MRIKAFGLIAVVVLVAGSFWVDAADYSDEFSGPKLSATFAFHDGKYAGEIRLGENRFPVQAHEDGSQLAGTFTSGTDQFPFTATLQGNEVTLVTDGATYTLQRAANPPANPTAQASHLPGADSDPFASYAIVQSSDYGKSIMRQFPAQTTARADAPKGEADKLLVRPSATGAPAGANAAQNGASNAPAGIAAGAGAAPLRPDPGRYKQIPLRDESDPLPGH